MPQPKTSDVTLLETLGLVFREHGYEGASLSLIAEATGLRRASLYHRFPGGKQEMALAVLAHVHQRFAEELLAPVAGPGSPEARTKAVAKKLGEFYEGGARSCLVDTLSLGEQDPEVREAVAAAVEAVVGALARIARDADHAPAAARRLAEDALLRVQGALVLARVTGDTKAFQRVLKELPALLTA